MFSVSEAILSFHRSPAYEVFKSILYHNKFGNKISFSNIIFIEITKIVDHPLKHHREVFDRTLSKNYPEVIEAYNSIFKS